MGEEEELGWVRRQQRWMMVGLGQLGLCLHVLLDGVAVGFDGGRWARLRNRPNKAGVDGAVRGREL